MAEQSYASHAHRPTLTTIAGLFSIAGFVPFAILTLRQPSLLTFGLLSTAAAVFTLVLISRAYTVRLQDRIIRLEMLGRLSRIGRDREFSKLTTSQIVALRFASDAELGGLVDRTVAEHLTSDQIKRAVTNWQADLHRT